MSCRSVRSWIPRYVEGELPPDATLRLARHLDRCTSCRIVLARERRLGEILDGMEDVVDVDASFLEAVMAALPDRTAPGARAPRTRLRRGLKLASIGSTALLCAGTVLRLLPELRIDLAAPAMPRFTPESADGWLGLLGLTVRWVRITAESFGWSEGGSALAGGLPGAPPFELAVVGLAVLALASAALALAARTLPRVCAGSGSSAASPVPPPA